MASMIPGCNLSISSNMNTELAQALTLPRIHSCNWSCAEKEDTEAQRMGQGLQKYYPSPQALKGENQNSLGFNKGFLETAP